MELNGVANLKILTDELKELATTDIAVMSTSITPLIDKMQEQLDLLERYMIEYQHCTDPNNMELVTAWHEIKANPSKFPTNRERHQKRVAK